MCWHLTSNFIISLLSSKNSENSKTSWLATSHDLLKFIQVSWSILESQSITLLNDWLVINVLFTIILLQVFVEEATELLKHQETSSLIELLTQRTYHLIKRAPGPSLPRKEPFWTSWHSTWLVTSSRLLMTSWRVTVWDGGEASAGPTTWK